MKLIFLAIFLLQPMAKAADFDFDYDEAEKLEFETGVDEKTYSPSELKKKGVKAKKLSTPKPTQKLLPDHKLRDATYLKVEGLGEAIAGYDEMKRDILYVNARTRTVAELQKQYPEIPEPVLSRLHALVKKP